MISLAAVVLLDGYGDSVFISLPCTLAQGMLASCSRHSPLHSLTSSTFAGIEAVTRVADNLANAPVPSTHVCFAASNNLRKLLSKTELALKRT